MQKQFFTQKLGKELFLHKHLEPSSIATSPLQTFWSHLTAI
jgi:hypothetical protein